MVIPANNSISYYYDDLGNLIQRKLTDSEIQNYFYDLYDQLVKVEIFKPEQEKETWVYTYEEETNITNAHQPFRLQNQYCATERDLH
ncbi:hypothetical protein [Neisseria zalophi]|uniref:hypothetical protein n=1 Tax=Neisseria zalophi TaxID=640030 RepID=UPI001CDA43BB|nr:hypothetical protein [Neisseria zalophi]